MGWAMVEVKPNDQGERLLKVPETKALASSDAKVIVNPSAKDKQLAEVDRTNKSSGSLTELNFKSQGLSREQVLALMEEQEESLSIDYGDGRDASRKSGLTEKDLVSVGGKSYDANTVLTYDSKQSGIVSDAATVKALSENQDKINLKPVEVASPLIKAGLDYNEERVSFTQKLVNFVQSAEARLMAPVARQAYFQGMIDKTLGVGEGLNQAKEEIKDSARMAASKAWTALQDGSVASVATHVDAAVMKTIQQAMKAVEEAAKLSKELAAETRQMLYDYLQSKGLTPAELEYAGVPKDYFDGMKPSSEPVKANDTVNAMSKADDLGGMNRPGDFEVSQSKIPEGTFLVGKGGDWPVLNERPSADVVQQTGSQSCVAAVGEMLSERSFVQAELIEKVGTVPERLLSVLGPDWRGGFILEEAREKALDIFLRSGKPWGAELRDKFYHRVEMGHMVVVDGLDEAGNLMIRDPQHATKYEMTRESFLKHWSDRALYRIRVK